MNNILLIPIVDSSDQSCLIPFNFRTISNDIRIDGYQLYAVEKWIVDRKRSLPVLTVYTGHPEHTIPVVSLAPENDEEWEKAIHHLRRDGARPKQTPHGVIMNTSLAGFRSDFTIVYVPNGDFGAIKDQLYTNINLLRMGCSGRSALTLEEPSDTTKDRFISMYHLPDTSFGDGSALPPTSNPHKSKQKPQRAPVTVLEVYKTLNPQHATPLSPGRVAGGTVAMVKTKDKPVFNKTVLELVKLIQAALAIFGMYDTRYGSIKPKMIDNDGKFVIDGLLCDVTVEGIQRWTSEIGEPCVGVEPMERVADPSIVSALLSLVLAIRNKLATLGYAHVPKDPFLHPHQFLVALSIYVLGTGSGSTASPASASTLTFHSPNYSQSHFASAHFPISLPPPRPGHHRSLSTLTLPNSVFGGPGGTSTTTLMHSLGPGDIVFHPGSASGSKKNLASIPMSLPTATLTRAIIQSINAMYVSKVGSGGGESSGKARRALSGDGGRVRRAIKGKLGDLGNAVGVGDKDKDRDSDNDARGAMSEGEGGAVLERGEFKDKSDRGFAGIASNQLLSGLGSLGSGIGNLASGIGLGLGLPGSGGAGAGGAAIVSEPFLDLSTFVEMVAGAGEREGRIRDKKREKEQLKMRKHERERSDDERDRKTSRDSFGESPKSGGLRGRVGRRHRRDRDKDGARDDGNVRGVGGTVRALWSGHVLEIVKLRELIEEMQCPKKEVVSVPVAAEEQRKKGEGDKVRWPDQWALGNNGVASDGDVDNRQGSPVLQRGGKFGDGYRSTEDESDNSQAPVRRRDRPTSIGSGFSGWSGVRDKIGSWRHLTDNRNKRKKDDVNPFGDVPRTSADAKARLNLIDTGFLTPPRLSAGHGSTQSPTLHPFYSGDDEDLLSSGQVSPISDRLESNPFHTFGTPSKLKQTSNEPSAANSTLNLFANKYGSSLVALDGDSGAAEISDYMRKVEAFDVQTRKRPWGKRIVQNRVLSWSDPLSARGIVDAEGDSQGHGSGTESDVEETDGVNQSQDAVKRIVKRKRTVRRGETLPVQDSGATGSADEGMDDFFGQTPRQRRHRREAKRRRSFHDLAAFRDIRVLTPEQMKIDVELCGHYLVLSRREEHLVNVMQCLEIFANQLSATNASLRSDYQSHLTFLTELESHTKILAALEASRAQAAVSTQETNTLLYESDQFRLHDLWRMASMPRHKVLALREKVFGSGGRRRVKQGVYGAHGKFDRVQWTLDGRERLVDSLGRTESEAEEESIVEREKIIHREDTAVGTEGDEDNGEEDLKLGEDERDVVDNPTIKPMWLLQFFTNWGARWGAAVSVTAPEQSTSINGTAPPMKENVAAVDGSPSTST
ncbi:hypothetical protein EYR36_005935 [Pleurotus pulmonarius]|nr:hypothetical protein EYR36_005935 [Pleurotus pulmonarius]KAF4600642.1 hypothetical protein EYR38_005285 [Pleurotus pulmonarius]